MISVLLCTRMFGPEPGMQALLAVGEIETEGSV